MVDPNLELTPNERGAEERDQNILEAARRLNALSGSVNVPMPAGAIPASSLSYWCSLGNLGKVKLELQNKPDVNEADADGYTALHGAAENGHIEIVRLLLQNGADPKLRAFDKTPAELAKKYPEIVRMLSVK